MTSSLIPSLLQVGFVDEGAYAFSHGVGLGLGFVSLAALVVAKAMSNVKTPPNCMLYKCPSSSIVHTARILVVV